MSARDLLQLAVSDGIPRRSIKVALVVGPILTLINQGDVLFGRGELDWAKAALTFLVPYMVATIGAVGAASRKHELGTGSHASSPCQAEAPSLMSRPPKPSESGAYRVQARVHVTLKKGVLDPQGKAIESALASLGFQGVDEVRQGKVIEIALAETNPEAARRTLEDMCEKLLANTVIEDYAIELD